MLCGRAQHGVWFHYRSKQRVDDLFLGLVGRLDLFGRDAFDLPEDLGEAVDRASSSRAVSRLVVWRAFEPSWTDVVGQRRQLGVFFDMLFLDEIAEDHAHLALAQLGVLFFDQDIARHTVVKLERIFGRAFNQVVGQVDHADDGQRRDLGLVGS